MSTHKFSELRNKMSPAARAESDRLYKQALAEMPLNGLRSARGLSRKTLSEALHIQQPAAASSL
ncbi:MAG: hypothetical protein LBR16_06755 [Treponema sp.]|jgi:predicted XRE-type DNA-binding protein|nr:hypothetical protein [Treponema sp.]